MKGWKLFVFTFALLFVVTVRVNAATKNVSNEAELRGCVTDSNVCKLTQNITITETIEIVSGQDVTITLGESTEFNITGTTTLKRLFKVSNGSLVIDGKGTITGYGRVFSVLGNLVTGEAAKKAELEIGKDVKVYAKDVSETDKTAEEVILIAGDGAVLDLYGLVQTDSSEASPKSRAAIQGIGTITGEDCRYTEINIYDGAKVIALNNDAIYHPQYGDLNIFGGEITGKTGIEMRAGNLLVLGGNIKGTAVPSSSVTNGNGSTTLGAGIAIAQHNTELELNVVVLGGTIEGYTALYESNPEENSAEATDKVSVAVLDGEFNAINGGREAVHSETEGVVVLAGGNYNTAVDESFLSEDSDMVEGQNGVTVVTAWDITVLPTENGTVTAVDKAREGEKVTLNITANKGYKVGTIKVTDDLFDEEVTVDGNSFEMPNASVTVEVTFVADDVKVPNTVDNVAIYVIAGLISLIGVGFTINKLRRNA